MGSLFTLALCLITLFSLASCASTTRVSEAKSVVERAPEGDYRAFYNKEANRENVRSKY